MKIFVASSGRSGTGFLWKVWDTFTDFEAHHEEWPLAMGELRDELNTSPYPGVPRFTQKAREISAKGPYIDTAHQFMRGFYPYALSEMPDLKVIHLVRSPLEVMRSRLSRGCVPNGTSNGSLWVGKHGLPLNLIYLPEWDDLNPLEKIAWDWIEHEERYWRYKGRFAQTLELSFEDLTGPDSVRFIKSMFEEFQVSPTKEIVSLRPYNSNPSPSKVQEGDLESFRRVVRSVRDAGCSDLAWLDDPLYTGLKDFR